MEWQNVEIRSVNGNRGLFAARPLAKDDHVMHVRGEEKAYPSRHSVQVGVDRHLHPDERPAAWQYLNHSCRPNVAFLLDPPRLVALHGVERGDELSFNYLTSEWDMAEPFDCRCGEPDCFGRITGFKQLDSASQHRVLDDALPHIQLLHAALAEGALQD